MSRPASSSAVRPIARSTYGPMVTERLRAGIVNGTRAPGSQLNEGELASEFGVSRGPVREALQRLIQEGLVRSEPHRGVFVPVLSDDDVRDIYLARTALESAAVTHVIDGPGGGPVADDLDRFVTLMAESAAADDWEAVGNHDLDFHIALVAATGSERLQRMFSTVISETRLCIGVLAAAEVRNDLVEEHRQIAAMVRDGRADDALAALTKHFDNAMLEIACHDERTLEEETA